MGESDIRGTRFAPRVRGPHVDLFSLTGAAYLATQSAWRYFITGHPVLGSPRDNATLLHDATVYYGDHPRPRLTRARWRRLARRWAALGVPGSLAGMEGFARLVDILPGAAPEWATWPYAETLTGYAVAAPLTAGAIYAPRLVREWRARELRREIIYPATKVACAILGQKWDRRTALSMLELPPGFGEPSDDDDAPQPEVRLYLPPVPLDTRVKARIAANVGARLGLPDAQGEWREFGGRAWVTLQGADVPPRRVDLSDAVKLDDDNATSGKLRDLILSADLDRPIIGVASGGRVVRLDFADDSPNVAASGGTGTGKSTMLRLLAVQRMRNGAGRVILDLKGVSHPYARRLPPSRVLYFHRIEDIHDAAVAIGEELFRRRDEAVAAQTRGEPMPAFRPIDVDVEEANSLIDDLNAYWTTKRREIKAENKILDEANPYGTPEPEPPVPSPAVTALGFLIQMGRELSMFPFYAGQRLSAGAFGGRGGDRRESFQQRALAKWTRQTWKMLCPDVPYRVCPSGPRGMWAVVRGDRVDMVRVPFVSVDMAVQMIMDSPDSGEPVLSAIGGVRVQVSGRTVPGEVVRTSLADRVSGQLSTLSDAVSVLGVSSVEALRSAVKQDATFPAPAVQGGPGKAHLYDLGALVRWQEARTGRAIES